MRTQKQILKQTLFLSVFIFEHWISSWFDLPFYAYLLENLFTFLYHFSGTLYNKYKQI